jgi:hypothetical protein
MGDPLGHSETRCGAGRRVLADEGGSARQGFTGVRHARRSYARIRVKEVQCVCLVLKLT